MQCAQLHSKNDKLLNHRDEQKNQQQKEENWDLFKRASAHCFYNHSMK